MLPHACHEYVDLPGKVARLELSPNVTGALRGDRINPERPIAIVMQRRDEAAKPSAAEFHNHCRRWWQSGPDLWPDR